jgi:hypothetical protein
LLHCRFRRPAHGRSSREMRRRMRPSKSCRSPRIDQQGGRRALLPRGSGSWYKRCRRMPSVVGWRRSGLLPQRKQRCLRRLGLDCLGQSFESRLLRGKVLRAQSFHLLLCYKCFS